MAYNWDATLAVAEAYSANDPVSMAIYSSDNARDTTKYFTSSEMGISDPPAHWNWNEELGHSQKFQNDVLIKKYFNEEQVMNYIYK